MNGKEAGKLIQEILKSDVNKVIFIKRGHNENGIRLNTVFIVRRIEMYLF